MSAVPTDPKEGGIHHRSDLRGSNAIRALLLVGGLAFVLAGLIFNEVLLAPLLPETPLRQAMIAKVRAGQLGFLGAGLVLILLSEATQRLPWLRSRMDSPFLAKVFLLVLSLLVSLGIVEGALRPFFEARHNLNLCEWEYT